MYALLQSAAELLFGCHHRKLSRVLTMEGQTFRVRLECGSRFKYSLETMSLERRSLPATNSYRLRLFGARGSEGRL